jgi:DNA primase
MHQAGITNVVSSSGTSLTKEQIKLISRYTKNVTILYDGDAAGIKASFRGIDMILEEGLNVRVVLFPDGDDPDSYSKKVSTTELETYIKEHTQDFLSFKAELLLGEGMIEPSQRVKLIHDIVHSISLIPDQISRSIYTKEIANRFEIDENIILNELARIRKVSLTKELPESQLSTFLEVEKKPTEQAQTAAPKQDKIKIYERNLIRKLIKFGPYAIELEQLNSKGEKLTIETSVAELICHELETDELRFDFEHYQRIYEMVKAGIEENVFYKSSYFLRLENPEIVKIVADFESEEYELSHNWFAKHRIETNTELDILKRDVTEAIYAFKIGKIQARIDEVQEELEHIEDITRLNDLLSEQIVLERVKQAIAAQLGRTILR